MIMILVYARWQGMASLTCRESRFASGVGRVRVRVEVKRDIKT